MALSDVTAETDLSHDLMQKYALSDERPPTVVDRYFTKKYSVNLQKKEGEDTCILIHSNRICIITLAPSHPVLEQKKKIESVSFSVGKVNRLDNKVSGKSKRGAQWLGAGSPLCSLSCGDGSTYFVCPGVKGQLIEVNEALIQSPHLINEEPLNIGYIGILLPPMKEFEQEIARLLTEEQYKEVLSKRVSNRMALETAAGMPL